MLRTCAAALAVACLFISVARGAEVNGLYDTVVLPDKSRESSFIEAMRQVAVRVSGTREAGDRILSGKPDARRYVQRFSFQPDGSAAVSFDGTSFDQLLTSSGLPIWGRERPATLVWLGVPDAAGRLTWQGVNDRSPERDVVEQTAKARGLPLIWPNMDAADLGAATSFSNNGSRGYEQLTATAGRYRADAVLMGIGVRDASGNVLVRWTFAYNNEATDLQGSLDEGVHLAADRCSRLLAVAAGARAEVPIQVVGVRDLDGYARVLTYLEGLTIVSSVAVEQLRGDELDLRIAVRGDANALRRTVGLGKRLASVEAVSGDRIRFELRP